MGKVKNIQLSEIRKRIRVLSNERNKAINSLLKGEPLMNGIAYDMYKKCGKKNCKCTRGELHGPYPALSVYKEGKQRIFMIRREDKDDVISLSRRYGKAKKILARIRKINRQIDKLLVEARDKTTQEYR